MIDLGLKRRAVLAGSGALALGLALRPSQLLSATLSPELDEKQLGQLAFIDRLSRQLPSDWAFMGSDEPGQGNFDAYRYQLAMMSYTLSLAQYHFTPAWRERHHETSRKLIEKMMQFDVWGYWELTSRGAKITDPDLKELGPGWIDPVRWQNIMYSGHLFQMVTTHHMLFGAGEYESPKSLTFVYDPVARGMGIQEFPYDVHSLANVLIEQFRINGWRGIECEPNAIFPECNQHPLLGLSLYDACYGTEHFPMVSQRFMERFEALGYLGANASYMSYLMIKQEKVIRWDQAWGDGWTGTFLHAWNKDVAHQAYWGSRSRFIEELPGGSVTIKMPKWKSGYSHGHGFMATAAAEIGDHETRDALLDYADRYWDPTWEGETLRYPRRDVYNLPGDAPNVWRRVQPLTGNGLIGLARLGGRNRLFDMIDQPFDKAHYSEPSLTNIDYPRIQVLAARYDRASSRLAFTLRSGRSVNQPLRLSYCIANLDRNRRFYLAGDGRPLVRNEAGALRTLSDDLEARWSDNGLEISQRLAGRAAMQLVYA